MKNYNFLPILPVLFALFFALFTFMRAYEQNIDSVYLSMSIFLFATLSGFFISSQAKRYSNIVSKVTDFDGTMSYLYRSISVFGEEAQKQVAEILKKHYSEIIKNNNWDYYFTHKTSTLTDLNNLVDKYTTHDSLNGGQSAFASRAYFGLGDMQKIRKNLIALYHARIPRFQWYLVDALAVILIISVAVVPTNDSWLPIVIKSSFATVLATVLILLRRLNNLTLFEDMAGQSSAQDVLDIIVEKK